MFIFSFFLAFLAFPLFSLLTIPHTLLTIPYALASHTLIATGNCIFHFAFKYHFPLPTFYTLYLIHYTLIAVGNSLYPTHYTLTSLNNHHLFCLLIFPCLKPEKIYTCWIFLRCKSDAVIPRLLFLIY